MLRFEIETPGGNSLWAFVLRFWWTVIGCYHALKFLWLQLSTQHKRFDWRRVPKRTGDTVVITGATGAIGAEVVKKLLQCGMHVIIGCRDPAAGYEIVKKIRQKGITTGTAETHHLNLTCLNSVREFAYKILSKKVRVNILINNAGVMIVPYSITVDGFEHHFQVNYLGHFLLTHLLLPRLKTSSSNEKYGRVVSVSSIAHFVNSTQPISLSSTRQVALSNFLDIRLQAEGSFVRSYAVHPGFINSDIWENCSWGPLFLQRLGTLFKRVFFKKPDQGADSVLFTALSPDIESKGGTLICNCDVIEHLSSCDDEKIHRKLWEISCRYLGIDESSNCSYDIKNEDYTTFYEAKTISVKQQNDKIQEIEYYNCFNNTYLNSIASIIFRNIDKLKSTLNFLHLRD